MHTPGMHTPGMHTPGMNTPRGGPPGNMGQKYPSMTSVHTMLSQGYLPPGHGYVPKPIKPDKPYGPTYVSVLNRTWRGPGRKYINYAIATWCVAILFLCASGLYIGHRNVSRMIVLRTEWFGAIFTAVFILLTGLTFHFIYRARQESNRWRSHVRFRAEGLYHVVPYNPVYDPEDDMVLETGTYGKKALREIPKPGRRGRKGRKKQQQGGGQPRPPMESVAEEGPEKQQPPRGPPQAQYGPPQGQYGPPQGQYGPPQGQYGPPQGQYGPPQGQYGPPSRSQYGQPPPAQGQYGPHPGGTGPPRGFMPMDTAMDPMRYGGRMPIKHSGIGESSM